MRRPLVAAAVAAAGALVAALAGAHAAQPPRPAHAPSPQPAPAGATVQAFARVTQIHTAAGQPTTLTLSRGGSEGLTAAPTPRPIYRRDRGQGSAPKPGHLPSVDFSFPATTARVTTAQAHIATATLATGAPSTQPPAQPSTQPPAEAPLRRHDLLAYDLRAPASVATRSLFLVLAKDVGLYPLRRRTGAGPLARPGQGGPALVSLAEVLAATGPGGAREAAMHAALDRGLDALVAEVRARTADAAKLHKTLHGACYPSEPLERVFATADRPALGRFLDFVAAYPGRYIGQDWRLVEVYATWLDNGCPSGRRDRLVRQLAPAVRRAQEALKAGDLSRAEERYRAVLQTLPDHPTAKPRAASLAALRVLRARVARDPDDSTARWDILTRAFDLGAYDLASAQVAALARAGYRPRAVERYRAYLLVRRARYADAIAVLSRLTQAGDARAASWLRFARALQRLKADPDSPVGWVERAELAQDEHRYAAAARHAHRALDALAVSDAGPAHAAPAGRGALRARARRLLERARARARVDDLRDLAVDAARTHAPTRAAKHVQEALRLCRSLGTFEPCLTLLDATADAAREVEEASLCLVLRRIAARIAAAPAKPSPASGAPAAAAAAAPVHADVWANLAWARYFFLRPAAAAEAIEEALRRDPTAGWPRLTRARIALDGTDPLDPHGQGNPKGATVNLALARTEGLAAAKDPTYAWPRVLLARVAAAQGRWDEALRWAREAHHLQPESGDMQTTLAAVQLGREATLALALASKRPHRKAAHAPREDPARHAESPPSHDRLRLRLVRALTRLDLGALALGQAARVRDPALREDAYAAVARRVAWSFSPGARAQAARRWHPKTPAGRRAQAAALALEAVARHRVPAPAPAPGPGTATAATSKPATPAPAKWQRAEALQAAAALTAARRFDDALALLGAAKGEDLGAVRGRARAGLQAEEALRAARAACQGGAIPTCERRAQEAMDGFAQAQAPGGQWEAAFFLAATGATGGTGATPSKLDEALAAATRWLAAARADGDQRGAQDLARQRAFIASRRGDLTAVRAALEGALDGCRRADDQRCEATVALDLSAAALDEGRLAEARALAQLGRRRAAQVGAPSLQRKALSALANVHLVAVELDAAGRLGRELVTRSRGAKRDGGAGGDVAMERFGLMVLGAVAMRRSDAAAALARFRQVYALGQRSGQSWMRAEAKLFEGRTLLDAAHRPGEARVAFEQARDLAREQHDEAGVFRARLGRARALLELGQAPEAVAALRVAGAEAKTLGRRPYEAHAALWLARALAEASGGAGGPGHGAKARLVEAVGQARRAVAWADKLDMEELQRAAHHALGRALRAQYNQDEGRKAALEEAAKHLVRAVELDVAVAGRAGGDDQAQAGYRGFGRGRELYGGAIDTLLKLGRVDQAMEILERSHDAKLKELFAPGRVQAQDAKVRDALGGLDDAKRRQDAARKALAAELGKATSDQDAKRLEALNRRVAETSAQVRRLLMHLKRDHRGLYQAMAVRPASLVRRRADLPAGALVVAYFAAGDTLYTFLVSADQPEARATRVAVAAETLDETVASYRASLRADPPVAEAAARKLYGWLLEPIVKDLDAAKTVLIVPFGTLYYLPFHALVTTPPGVAPRYAVERWRMAYLSSTTLDRLLEPRDPSPRGPDGRGKGRLPKVLAFANPDGTLPGARREVQRIREEAFPKIRALFEGKATKARFFDLSPGYDVLHFATHGVLDPDPLQSHLKMAHGPLTVDEIAGFAGLEGHTSLVVLSACQTAMERGRSHGDEVISVAEAFATAGAPALIASLWDVDDDATAELMTAFYKNLRRDAAAPSASAEGGGRDLLDALRGAQLKLLRAKVAGVRPWADPARWAAFQLIGDYR